MAQTEPLFKDNKDRFVIFPVKHHDLWDFYKTTAGNFWSPGEIDLEQDLQDWNNHLDKKDRLYIKQFLAIFPASLRRFRKYDEIPNEELKYPEANFFYGFQRMTKNIHIETCSLLLDRYLNNENGEAQFLTAMEALPVPKKQAALLANFEGYSIAEKLLAGAAIEKIFFAGAMSAILSLKKRNLMPGLCFATELISRDRRIHGSFAVQLYNRHLLKRLPKERIREIILEVLSQEEELITGELPVSLLEINTNTTSRYLEFTADNLLLELECDPAFGSSNPFEFLENKQDSLLAKRAGEYRKAGNIKQDNEIKELNTGNNY